MVLKKLIVLNLICGLLAEPVAKVTRDVDGIRFVDNDLEQGSSKIALTPHRDHDVGIDRKSLLGDAAKSVFGYRNSAINLAVDAIEWTVSQSPAVVFGTIATVAVCRWTQSCDLNYEDYIPAEVSDYITPDRMARAEEFAMNAVEKYLSVDENTL